MRAGSRTRGTNILDVGWSVGEGDLQIQSLARITNFDWRGRGGAQELILDGTLVRQVDSLCKVPRGQNKVSFIHVVDLGRKNLVQTNTSVLGESTGLVSKSFEVRQGWFTVNGDHFAILIGTIIKVGVDTDRL